MKRLKILTLLSPYKLWTYYWLLFFPAMDNSHLFFIIDSKKRI
ncbi:hypothetical protein PROSTU_01120 [Providencia stuartii ATCC 25827]|uniref:Uncharacterized protein n=1 Tax=Providencia stuartii ATCC 25827 TaxID=471874 RepID=A0AA86YXU5_PROST|nr:hypothetical protein PROSTU_01120 [Providencia stuartii ATCC 25827]